MAESIKQKLGFVVAAMMVAAALAVLNVGSPAGAQQQRCGDGGGGGGGGGTPSASPSPTESEEPFPPITIPPIIPEETESSSPSPTETSSAARKCSSDISLNYQGPTKKKPSRRSFSGKVTSAEDECEVGRKVTLKKGKKTVDTTLTNNKGGFKMPANRADGKYFVETPKENVVDEDGRINCGAAKSKTVTV